MLSKFQLPSSNTFQPGCEALCHSAVPCACKTSACKPTVKDSVLMDVRLEDNFLKTTALRNPWNATWQPTIGAWHSSRPLHILFHAPLHVWCVYDAAVPVSASRAMLSCPAAGGRNRIKCCTLQWCKHLPCFQRGQNDKTVAYER